MIRKKKIRLNALNEKQTLIKWVIKAPAISRHASVVFHVSVSCTQGLHGFRKKPGILKNVESPWGEIAFNMATECGRLLVLTELK